MLDHFIQDTKSILYVAIDEKLMITDHNEFFLKTLAMNGSALGHKLQGYLSQEETLFEEIEKLNGTREKIIFKGVDNSHIPFQCSLYLDLGTLHIFGEKPTLTASEIMQKMTLMNNEMTNLTRELQNKNRELSYANSTIKTLKGILPICSFCKGIRDDEGYWQQLEEYMTEQTDAELSHSICPDCIKEQYPELDDEDEE